MQGVLWNILYTLDVYDILNVIVTKIDLPIAWQKEMEKYRNCEIIKEKYDRWRYTYSVEEVERTREKLDELSEQSKQEN